MGSHAKNHDYHIINPSIWPFAASISAFLMLTGAVLWMNDITSLLFIVGFIGVLYVMYAWWKDVILESNAGDHTPVVRIGLRYGFIFFIISEVMFFVAWFWSYFNYALYPTAARGEDAAIPFAAGGMYPPAGVHAVDPLGLPLINTLILLLSGCTLTWAHHALLEMRQGDGGAHRKQVVQGLTATIVLGFIFTCLQAYEYGEAIHHGLTIDNTYYGAAFFMATGFHGFHVIVGTIFLTICLIRVLRGGFTAEKHIGFEAAAWYWHFVDVVWLFLFGAIYCGTVWIFATGGGGAH